MSRQKPLIFSQLHAIVFPYRDGVLKKAQIRHTIFRWSASLRLAASLIVPIP